MNNGKKIFFVIMFFLFFSFLYSECLNRVIQYITYTKVTDTICKASANGNCYKWDVVTAKDTKETNDCKESCNLKECKNWERTNTTDEPKECMVANKPCVEFASAQLNAPCIRRVCPYEKTKVVTIIEKCTNAICN
ncbi:MAG: hypothetical protein ACP5SD_00415 [Elusimicrobiales bacterium]|nr:hypothetical protein [Elusimicrobiales bacterium]HOJ85819.1 hypothetical protein [Elusimicrobiales bacterium]HOL62031.1 hypothetical protein [Elusimicrobiales bacterium]